VETFDHQGITIAYRREGAGPALLFLHNGGMSSTIWRHQVEALSDRFTTVAVDLPGFGASPRPVPPLDLDGLVDVVAALVDAEGLAPAVVVGNCMGSNIAVKLATERPDQVRALVLVNPLTEATFSSGWLGPLHKMQRLAPRTTRTVRAVSRRIVVPGAVARLVVRFQLGSRGAARGLQRDPQLVACNVRRDQLPALVDVLDDMSAYGAIDHLAERPGVPVCTVWGSENRVLSTRVGRELDRRLEPDRSEVLSGCGHLAMLEAPDEVTSIIRTFVDEQVPVGVAAAERAPVDR
jgi:pimeloyl-ACP methyl ester carboxylesterase